MPGYLGRAVGSPSRTLTHLAHSSITHTGTPVHVPWLGGGSLPPSSMFAGSFCGKVIMQPPGGKTSISLFG